MASENKNIKNHKVKTSIFDNKIILGRQKNNLQKYLDWMTEIL